MAKAISSQNYPSDIFSAWPSPSVELEQREPSSLPSTQHSSSSPISLTAPSFATISVRTPLFLRSCLARARAPVLPRRTNCLHSFAIAKSPRSSPDIVESSRPLLQYPRQQRTRIVSIMSSSEDDTPLVRAKDQGKRAQLPLTLYRVGPRAPCSCLTSPSLRSPNLCF